MSARLLLPALAAFGLVVGCDGPSSREREVPVSPATTQWLAESFMIGSGGVFDRSEPSAGVMTIARQEGEWRIAIRAGGIPNGGATAADCELAAVGPFLDGVFTARLVPFESDLGGMSADDLGDDPPSIVVSLTPDGAIVTDDQNAAARYCANGSDITGRYIKKV